MKIEFDPNKSAKNEQERGLPFELAHYFNWETAYYWEDLRKPYPEERFMATGFLGNRLHVICFVLRADSIRIVSFRKANKREGKLYYGKKNKTAH